MAQHETAANAEAGADRGGHLSYEAFLDWADEDTLAEWVDGEIVMTSPASARHQQIKNFLVSILGTYARLHTLGEVLDGPFQMKLARSGREPDVLFLANPHLSRLKKTYLDGPADLVIEIISPESVERDRTQKFQEYQAAGIPEYWLIDSEQMSAEFYQLDDHSTYQRVPVKDDAYHSRVLAGFWLRATWLWQDPLPASEHILLQIDRDTYAAYLREQLRQADLPEMKRASLTALGNRGCRRSGVALI